MPDTPAGKPTSLQAFDLLDLQQYTKEGSYSPAASKDFHLFYVGRDNVHELLKHVLGGVTVSLYLNMFGFDDDELNDILMAKAMDPSITMLITLDKSRAKSLADFNTHFVIGQSATHQISHTKGFVADGVVGGEGSTNWSASGEGTFVVAGNGAAGGAGYKAQNNTQMIFTCPDAVARFQAQLIAEHQIAAMQQKATA